MLQYISFLKLAVDRIYSLRCVTSRSRKHLQKGRYRCARQNERNSNRKIKSIKTSSPNRNTGHDTPQTTQVTDDGSSTQKLRDLSNDSSPNGRLTSDVRDTNSPTVLTPNMIPAYDTTPSHSPYCHPPSSLSLQPSVPAASPRPRPRRRSSAARRRWSRFGRAASSGRRWRGRLGGAGPPSPRAPTTTARRLSPWRAPRSAAACR